MDSSAKIGTASLQIHTFPPRQIDFFFCKPKLGNSPLYAASKGASNRDVSRVSEVCSTTEPLVMIRVRAVGKSISASYKHLHQLINRFANKMPREWPCSNSERLLTIKHRVNLIMKQLTDAPSKSCIIVFQVPMENHFTLICTTLNSG